MGSASVVVIVASRGRPREVAHLLKRLAVQTHRPETIILCGVEPSDLPEEPASLTPGIPCRTRLAKPGLCSQRNAGLDAMAGPCDLVVFFDDDYVPSKFALEDVVASFEARPELVGLTGRVLADGISKGGVPVAEAVGIVDAYDAVRPRDATVASMTDRGDRGLYGCNMAYRTTAIGAERFDERLPLYGWLEDVDFSKRLGRVGRLAKSEGFAGAHCGVTHGRSPGERLGYSQVMNVAYLLRKGTVTRGFSFAQVSRNLLANHVRSLIGTEAWIDRRGRTRGNWLAFADLLRGRIDPEAILRIER